MEALPGPRVGELAKLIDNQCPYVQEMRWRLELLELDFGSRCSAFQLIATWEDRWRFRRAIRRSFMATRP